MASDLPGLDAMDVHGDARPHSLTSRAVLTRVARHRATAPTLVGLLAMAIALAGIGVPSVWYDEAATISAATRSWPQLLQLLGNVDAVHGLYYAIMHLVFDAVGYSPLSLRAPSVVAAGVAAASTVVLGRMLGTERFAVVAGLVLCLLPRATWMGGEGRSYAMTAAVAVILTIVLVRAQRSTGARWWVAYGVLAVVAIVLFVYLALVVVAHAVTMAWWLATTRAAERRLTVPIAVRWLVAAAGAAVLTLPFVLEVSGQSGQVSWIDPLGPQTVQQVFQTQWFLRNPVFAWVGWVLIIVGAISMLRRGRGFSAAAIVLPGIVVPTTVLLIASEVDTPLFTPRYLTLGLPYVALAIAAAITALPKRRIAIVALLALAAISTSTAIAQRQPHSKEPTVWYEVAELIADQRAADGPNSRTAIIYGPVRRHASASTRVIAYSYPDAFAGSVDVLLEKPAAETGKLWEKRDKIDESLDRFTGTDVAYLITSIKRDRRPVTTAALESIGWRLTDSWIITDVNVLRYERK